MSWYDAMLRDALGDCRGCALSDPNGAPLPACPYWRKPGPTSDRCDRREAVKAE
ncbi:hypothetical protein SAMN04488138_1533 [Celeribacter halophilus]|uniref:Uncharacterized protein n=1 Tax=Celeribacter halophilus TaxID=576117 RepID=A0A1I3XFW2_9RHOB|nr:hypothetical protein SAMN04488138_1533 [Celeribacter halophilus]